MEPIGRGSRPLPKPDTKQSQRLAGDPPDFDDETTIKAPDGEYPKVIRYDQVTRTTYDIDTGETVVESITPIENVVIVETDLTPPVPQQRYAGQAKVNPVGNKVSTQTTSLRKKKASRFRHPFLRGGENRGR